jgi:glycosyltransferase involved in cell wall biosynthesis
MSDHTGTASIGITALIPCYNEIECIDLVYRQVRDELDGYLDIEILFVDDGSSDGTLDRIKSFAERDKSVRYISFARNFGQEAAFSAGFAYAAEPWTVQLDADL